LIANAQETAQKNGKSFFYERVLEFSYATIKGVCITKLLKSLYPIVDKYMPSKAKYLRTLPVFFFYMSLGCAGFFRLNFVSETKRNEAKRSKKIPLHFFFAWFALVFSLPFHIKPIFSVDIEEKIILRRGL
jgi:hypothetical protein